MFRLTALASAVILAILGFVPGLPPDANGPDPVRRIGAGSGLSPDGGTLTLLSGEIWLIARHVPLAPPVQAPPQVAAPLDRADGPLTQEGVSVIMYVAASTLNLRAGPSTGEVALAALPEGAGAEVLGPARDGWTRVRDPETGLTGFMASRYLRGTRP